MHARKLSGRARSKGADRDAGHLTHAVVDGAYPSCDAALCAKKPRPRSMGWQPAEQAPVTCERCIKALGKIANDLSTPIAERQQLFNLVF